MNIPEERLRYLFDRYRDRQLGAGEEEELMRWIAETGDESPLRNYLRQEWVQWESPVPANQPDWDRLLRQIVSIPVMPVASRNRRLWWAVAAACAGILIIGGTTWVWREKTKQPAVAILTAPAPTAVIAAGSNKAVLTLAGGKTIVLDSAHNGLLDTSGETHIVKVKDGQIDYETPGASTGAVAYNTLSTPKGGQYQLRLPDGSRVWLNAASSIRYPTLFSGGERKVEVSGEAYFDVARQVDKPFVVAFNGMSVEVLGTQFDIMTYTDEPDVRATLVEGSVRVRNGDRQRLLTPGQQAILPQTDVRAGNSIRIDSSANIEQVIAWKTGVFNFDQITLQSAMLQLARWYDVTVEYPAALAGKRFGGEMGRDLTLNQVLKLLDGVDMHFRLEGRKIIAY